ncbi:MAG: hypothetical protein AAGF56_09530 [Pseudomonadota bacterium]
MSDRTAHGETRLTHVTLKSGIMTKATNPKANPMFLNKFFVFVAAIAIPAMASAAPTRMYCEVTKNEGAFANQLFFEVEGDSARVVDGIILNEKGQPIPAKLRENSTKKLTISWDVMLTNNRGQQTKMAYRAALLKDSNRVVLTAKPHGYSNNFTARGRCQQTQNPLPGS